MGFIKAGFTGGFIGILIGVAAIFVKSPLLQKLSYLGFLLAEAFGKVCIDTTAAACSLAEKFTTVIATIIGNCIAYFIVGVLISLSFGVLKMWLSSEKTASSQEPQVQQSQQLAQSTPQQIQPQEIPKKVQEQVPAIQQRPNTPSQKIKMSKQRAQKKSRK